jgi:hypothetical protein
MRRIAFSAALLVLIATPTAWGQPADEAPTDTAAEPEDPPPAAPVDASASAPETAPVADPETVQPTEADATALAPAEPDSPAPAETSESSLTLAAEADTEPDADALIASLSQGDSAGDANATLEERPLQIYGFADVGFRHTIVDDDSPWLVLLNRHPSFFVGNANVYFDKQLHEKWRALMEVRFTYLNHGARRVTFRNEEIERTMSRESDYTDFQRDKNIGGVIPEQIWIDYAPVPLVKIRVGQWLSPYGIWNVDHGSPVIIGVNRPFIIGSQLIPEKQVGLLASGGSLIAGPVEWSYALGLSNGRTTVTQFEDLDSNKAITGRLALSISALGALDVGTTAYAGRHTESSEVMANGPNGIETSERISLQYDEVTYAFDLKWIWEGLHVQSEWLVFQRRFTEEGRIGAAAGGLLPDRLKWGGYGLIGYRLPWFPLMPYFKGEVSPDNTAETLGIPDKVALFTGGLNYRPIPRVVLKAEFTHAYFTETEGDDTGFTKAPLNFFDAQIAWAF